jgi:ketosteroid isomerase-like protein
MQSTESKDLDELKIRAILDRVMDSVHNLDYEGVRDFIPDDGLYFGSYAVMAEGYDELYEKQFSKVWPNIKEFAMVSSSINIHTAETNAWATCLFVSSAATADGELVERKGRMTFIFERRQGEWSMVHSHDSLYPAAPK